VPSTAPPSGKAQSIALALWLEILGINFDVMLPLIGQRSIFVDGTNRARAFARAAPDAIIGVDVKLWRIFVAVDAIDGAGIDAAFVFDTDARLGDNVSGTHFLDLHHKTYGPLYGAANTTSVWAR
jgi:hypothetical protein